LAVKQVAGALPVVVPLAGADTAPAAPLPSSARTV
jgi:hypothetical protein